MLKNSNVVMLPTNKKVLINNQLYLSIDSNPMKLGLTCRAFTFGGNFNKIPQHIYITSDEEIKESDWFLADIRNNISENNGNPIWELKQCTHIDNSWIFTKEVGIGFNPNWCKKIIATTDELYLSELFPVDNKIHSLTSRLPQPSQQFIEKYIEEYNKGNVITEVEVEYEDCGTINSTCGLISHTDTSGEIFYMGAKLKVNSDNTINIKPIKNSWNREEHIANIKAFAKEFVANTDTAYKQADIDKWIKENL